MRRPWTLATHISLRIRLLRSAKWHDRLMKSLHNGRSDHKLWLRSSATSEHCCRRE